MLSEQLQAVLFRRPSPFITVATCDLEGEPNAAPKLILKYDDGYVYLVDVPYGKTYENLKGNPKAAISFVDIERLRAYRIKGSVKILDSDETRKKHLPALDKLLNKMIVNRIVEGTTRGKGYGNYITSPPKDFILFETKLLEIVEYGLEDIKTRTSSTRTIDIKDAVVDESGEK